MFVTLSSVVIINIPAFLYNFFCNNFVFSHIISTAQKMKIIQKNSRDFINNSFVEFDTFCERSWKLRKEY